MTMAAMIMAVKNYYFHDDYAIIVDARG